MQFSDKITQLHEEYDFVQTTRNFNVDLWMPINYLLLYPSGDLLATVIFAMIVGQL